MSPADVRAGAAADLINGLAADPDGIAALSAPALRGLVGAVLRVYEAACANARGEIPPIDGEVSTTAAVVLACALARSQSLTPFDFALWYSHTAPRAERS